MMPDTYISFSFVKHHRPDALFAAMPENLKEDITDEYIGKALPNVVNSQFQVSFSYLLTTPPDQADLMSELAATKDIFPKAHNVLMKDMARVCFILLIYIYIYEFFVSSHFSYHLFYA